MKWPQLILVFVLLGLVSLLLFLLPVAHAGERALLDDELDIFAADFLDEVQARSVAENREYCGLFGIDAAGGLAATPALPGLRDSCEPAPEPEGFEALASYHTHGAYSLDADSEVPSLDDLLADIEEGIDGYIATPGGRLWLNLVADEASLLLCGPGCIAFDPDFRECDAYPPEEDYSLESLELRAEEDPGYC